MLAFLQDLQNTKFSVFCNKLSFCKNCTMWLFKHFASFWSFFETSALIEVENANT